MPFPILRLPAVVLVVVLALILPLAGLSAGKPPMQAGHAGMMAAAGHAGHVMPNHGVADPEQAMVCQQHCLPGAAILPAPPAAALALAQAAASGPRGDVPAASLAVPPPGPPPKALAT